jgi:large subunit ribosomal protein L22
MVVKYSFQGYDEKKMTRVMSKFTPISMKTTLEVLHYIKGRNIQQALTLLEEVSEEKRPVPFLRFKKDIPHRKGAGLSIGRFPVKVSQQVSLLLNSVIANAKDKGLDEKSLIIIHAAVQTGPKLWHYGRQRRRLRKVCHIELVAKEIKNTKKKITANKLKSGGKKQ